MIAEKNLDHIFFHLNVVEGEANQPSDGLTVKKEKNGGSATGQRNFRVVEQPCHEVQSLVLIDIR